MTSADRNRHNAILQAAKYQLDDDQEFIRVSYRDGEPHVHFINYNGWESSRRVDPVLVAEWIRRGTIIAS